MKFPKKSFPNKKVFKHTIGKCCICGENEYDLLDTHRWKEGSRGGKYSINNCLCLCTSCHRMVHTGKVKITGVHNSTKGTVVNYIDKNGKEQIKSI